MPKITSKRNYLELEEIEKIIKHAPSETSRVFITTLYGTGARISEVLPLEVKDIHFKYHEIEMPALKRKDIETKLVWALDFVWPLLEKYCNGRPSTWRLFPVRRRIAYQWIKVASLRAHIPGVYPHLLRHSFAIRWSKLGGDLTKLQRNLGHKDFRTTANMYLRYQTKDIGDEAKRIGM